MENNKNKPNVLTRRDTLKSLLIGGMAFTTLSRCNSPSEKKSSETSSPPVKGYGRTETEKIHDQKIMEESSFFTEHEAATLTDLIDIIVPMDDISGSASDAGVMEFLDFIVKDMTYHQLPLRQGVAWLNRKSNEKYNSIFINLNLSQKTEILDLIAYPDEVLPINVPGEKFFSKLRDLTLTGFYTSKIGLEALGYVGNRPNFWNGIPQEVLEDFGFTYDREYEKLYASEENRTKIAEWDVNGNLLN